MTLREAYSYGKQVLGASGVDNPAMDARLLIAHVCRLSADAVHAHPEYIIEPEDESRLKDAIALRASRVPLQHITGQQDFMGMTFSVNKEVLIPRPDTEILTEEVLKDLHDGMDILDLCTGSGCILISLLRYSNGCRGVGVDISPGALETAGRNGRQLLGERADISFELLDIFDESGWDGFCGSHKGFDIITSNPPYIETGEIEDLMPEVKDHDPRQALDGGRDGLDFYRQIAQKAMGIIRGGGGLYLEIGARQGLAVSSILEASGWRYIEVIKDYGGLDRVVKCIR